MASSSTSRAPAPSSIALPPAGFDSALDTPESTPGTSPLPGRSFQAGQPSLGAPGPHRISFSQAALTGQRNHRPSGASSRRYTGARRMSAASRARSLIDNEDGALTEDELRPVVPSLFHTGLIRKEPDATPLPLCVGRPCSHRPRRPRPWPSALIQRPMVLSLSLLAACR